MTGFNRGITWKQSANPFVVLDSSDQVIGYFFRGEDANQVTVSEIGFSNQSIFPSISSFLANYANRVSVNHLWFSLPQDHPFLIFCRDDLACKLLSHIAAVSGSMMWLINQTGTLKQICGEITRRLRQSTEFTRWQGLIEISTELGADFIEIDNG